MRWGTSGVSIHLRDEAIYKLPLMGKGLRGGAYSVMAASKFLERGIGGLAK